MNGRMFFMAVLMLVTVAGMNGQANQGDKGRISGAKVTADWLSVEWINSEVLVFNTTTRSILGKRIQYQDLTPEELAVVGSNFCNTVDIVLEKIETVDLSTDVALNRCGYRPANEMLKEIACSAQDRKTGLNAEDLNRRHAQLLRAGSRITLFSKINQKEGCDI